MLALLLDQRRIQRFVTCYLYGAIAPTTGQGCSRAAAKTTFPSQGASSRPPSCPASLFAVG
jgi:hypothetical protein